MKSTSNAVVGGRDAEMCDGVGMMLLIPRQLVLLALLLWSESLDAPESASDAAASLPARFRKCCRDADDDDEVAVEYEMRLELRDGDGFECFADDRSWS